MKGESSTGIGHRDPYLYCTAFRFFKYKNEKHGYFGKETWFKFLKKSNSVINGEVILKPAEEKQGKITFLGA